ncbi:hypothetical protein [Brenneria salicis]|nr:hypothetical protein [Brenneria salicis]
MLHPVDKKGKTEQRSSFAKKAKKMAHNVRHFHDLNQFDYFL